MSAKAFTIGGHTISYGGFLLREAGAGALTITKTVTGSGFDSSRTFAITITFDKAVSFKADGVSVGPVSSYTIHLHHNQACALTEIPELTQYEVTEELTAEDISLGYDDGPVVGGTGVIREGQPKTCSIGNTYDQYYVVGAKTVRFQFSNLNYDPTAAGAFPDTDPSAFTWTRVSSNPNRWDYHRESSNWNYAFDSEDPLVGLVPHFYGQDTGDIEVIEANLTGVTSGTEMFSHIDNLVAVRKWSGSSGITDTYGMFDNCFNLESVPTMDFSGENSLHNVFRGTRLTSVNLITSGTLTSCVGVFWGCQYLTAATISNTSNVTVMGDMFTGCSRLAVAPTLTTAKVTYTSRMFEGCTSLTSVPAYNMSKVTDASSMFKRCTSLESVTLLSIPKATNVTDMFYGCTGVKSGALALYNQLVQLSPAPTHSRCFRDCGSGTTTGAAELAQIPSDWK